MIPHRSFHCSYPKKSEESNDSSSRNKTKEVFGAHVHASFTTITPCASIARLKVDEKDDSRFRLSVVKFLGVMHIYSQVDVTTEVSIGDSNISEVN